MEIFNKVFNHLKYSPLYELVTIFRFRVQKQDWYKRGQKPPTPDFIKQEIVKKYANKYSIDTFVETGTYLGSMINSVKKIFKKIYTVELDEKLYNRARNKFQHNPHIKIVKGNSAKVLPKILKRVTSPTLFWLDAHFSKGITAKADKETPILEELNCILTHTIKKHIILIDDADCFNGKRDYPTIKYLVNFIKQKNPNFDIKVKYNIIRITPN